MSYFFNWNLNQIKREGYQAIGNPALIVSGARIDHLAFFEREIKEAVEDANPDLGELYNDFVVSYKNDKENKSDLEKITKTAGGVVFDEQHFYIIQPLIKISK
jgi:hypothetical protein